MDPQARAVNARVAAKKAGHFRQAFGHGDHPLDERIAAGHVDSQAAEFLLHLLEDDLRAGRVIAVELDLPSQEAHESNPAFRNAETEQGSAIEHLRKFGFQRLKKSSGIVIRHGTHPFMGRGG